MALTRGVSTVRLPLGPTLWGRAGSLKFPQYLSKNPVGPTWHICLLHSASTNVEMIFLEIRSKLLIMSHLLAMQCACGLLLPFENSPLTFIIINTWSIIYNNKKSE